MLKGKRIVAKRPGRSGSSLGTTLGGLVPPVVTYFALTYELGFSIPMLIGCLIGGGSWCLALYLGPETKGKEMVPDLVLA
jgi:SHS family lactate transporter-like MFS transporter